MPPAGDTTTEESAQDKPASKLPWRGTTFSWNHAWTTSLIGIGRDYNSTEDQFYGWAFLLKPTYYVVDQPKDKVALSAEIAWETELTDGNTTEKRETLFQDLGLGAKYSRAVFESGGSDKGEYKTGVSLSGKLRFPTSKYSARQGKYLTTQLGVSVSQQIKLLGSKADGLNNLAVGLGLTWGHLFSRSYSPTYPDLARPRQNATGQTEASDVLTTRSFAINTLTPTLTIGLPLFRELELGAAFGLLAGFTHEFSGKTPDGACPVTVSTGECPPDLAPNPDAPTTRLASTFDINLSYPILEVVAFQVGYQNNWQYSDTNELTNRNFFYGYDAQFYVDITANLDAIYSKATGRDKKPARKQAATRQTTAETSVSPL